MGDESDEPPNYPAFKLPLLFGRNRLSVSVRVFGKGETPEDNIRVSHEAQTLIRIL